MLKFEDGVSGIKLNGKWGYIDKTGKEVIPFIYEKTTDFRDGYSVVRLNGKCGIMKNPNLSNNLDNQKGESKDINATAMKSKVLVNLKDISFEIYELDGNSYFKLRDLAKVLTGSQNEFEVKWDNNKNAINLITGLPYTVEGGELKNGDGTDKVAMVNNSEIYINGDRVQISAYTINNNNYFKLRKLGEILGFKVDWDDKNSEITIDTINN